MLAQVAVVEQAGALEAQVEAEGEPVEVAMALAEAPEPVVVAAVSEEAVAQVDLAPALEPVEKWASRPAADYR